MKNEDVIVMLQNPYLPMACHYLPEDFSAAVDLGSDLSDAAFFKS